VALISGKTPGSTLSIVPNDGRLVFNSSQTALLRGMTEASPGTTEYTITETLPGAVGSPKPNVFEITVTEVDQGVFVNNETEFQAALGALTDTGPETITLNAFGTFTAGRTFNQVRTHTLTIRSSSAAVRAALGRITCATSARIRMVRIDFGQTANRTTHCITASGVASDWTFVDCEGYAQTSIPRPITTELQVSMTPQALFRSVISPLLTVLRPQAAVQAAVASTT
jgi:hypothetical protein